ncbi:MAG: hypothetical protein AAF587_20590 [Bacteroidota bacterium]
MDTEDRAEFEKKLQEQPELQKQVKQYQIAQQILKVRRHMDLRQEIDTIALRQSLKPSSSHSYQRIAIAASLALLLCTTMVYFSVQSRFSNKALFHTFFDPYPVLNGHIRGSQDSSNAEYQIAINAYANQDYQTSVDLLSRVKDQYNVVNVDIYLANAFLALGEAEKAVEILTTQRNLATYRPDLEWYLSLAYLQLGQSDSATKVLSILKTKSLDSFYRDKAKTSLKKLNSKYRNLPGIQ